MEFTHGFRFYPFFTETSHGTVGLYCTWQGDSAASRQGISAIESRSYLMHVVQFTEYVHELRQAGYEKFVWEDFLYGYSTQKVVASMQFHCPDDGNSSWRLSTTARRFIWLKPSKRHFSCKDSIKECNLHRTWHTDKEKSTQELIDSTCKFL